MEEPNESIAIIIQENIGIEGFTENEIDVGTIEERGNSETSVVSKNVGLPSGEVRRLIRSVESGKDAPFSDETMRGRFSSPTCALTESFNSGASSYRVPQEDLSFRPFISAAGTSGEYSLINADNENEFNYSYRNTDPKINALNFNDMYVRSNSPMASNCNSDVELELDTNGQQDLDLYGEHDSYPFVKKLLRRQPQNITVQTHKFVSEDAYDESNDASKNFKRRIKAGEGEFKLEMKETIDQCVLCNNKSPKNRVGEPTNQKYKKFTYQDIEKSLSQYHQKNEHNFSETDLLITYLSGMRSIYVISMNITKLKSYYITMSAISVSICLTIISPLVKNIYWGIYLISGGNAFIALLIFISRYFKFDSNSAQYAFIAKQFNKLELKVENEHSQNGGSALFQKKHEFAKNVGVADHYAFGVRGVSEEMENESKIMEINGYIKEFIPMEVVQLFPLIYNTNIIKFIRQIEQYRKNLIIRFRDIKNEIHYILYKWNSLGEKIEEIHSKYKTKTPQQEREKNRVLFLMDLKEKTKKELMQYNTIYIQMNDLFKKEIRYAETNQSCFGCSRVLKPDYDFSNLNPIVRDYLTLVIPE